MQEYFNKMNMQEYFNKINMQEYFNKMNMQEYFNTIFIVILSILYYIRRSKIVKLEKKMLILEYNILDLKSDMLDLKKKINYEIQNEQIQKIQIQNEQIQNEQFKNQKFFNVNKDELTIIKLNEIIDIGLKVILEDFTTTKINFEKIKNILISRNDQHKDTEYTYRLTRNKLKQIIIVAITQA